LKIHLVEKKEIQWPKELKQKLFLKKTCIASDKIII